MKGNGNIARYGILYRPSPTVGLFSYFIKFCGGLKYCDQNNLVPIIDMKNHDNLYGGKNGENSWEYFFEQPMGIGVDDVDAKDCIQIDVNPIQDFPYNGLLTPQDTNILDWRRIICKYIRIKHNNLKKYVNTKLDIAL